MENTVYYTLSTIPQVIAAIIALTGVFIVLRVEALKRKLMGFGQRVLDQLRMHREDDNIGIVYKAGLTGNDGRKRESRILGSISTEAEVYLIQQIKEIADIETSLFEQGQLKEIPKTGFNKQYKRMRGIQALKKELVSRTKTLFLISIGSILFSVFCLILAPGFIDDRIATIVILLVNYFGLALAIIFTGWLVWQSLEEKEV